jgi:hypothetical protein
VEQLPASLTERGCGAKIATGGGVPYCLVRMTKRQNK